jgi:hypothetical protein
MSTYLPLAGLPTPPSGSRVIAARQKQDLHTFSWPEFHRKTGKGQDGYQRYLRYVANAHDAAPRDPTTGSAAPAPALTPESIAKLMEGLTPKETAQTRQGVLGAYTPLIGQENASYNANQQNFTKGITAYTRGLAQFLKPLGQREVNLGRQTAGALAAESAALGGLARDQGVQGQQYLADQFSRMSASPNPFAEFAAARGKGIGAAIAAAGNAAQEHATLDQGALGQWLAGQPRLAAISGRQELAQGLSKIGAAHSSALSDYRSKLAASLQDAFNQASTDKLNRGVAKATFLNTLQDNTIAGKKLDVSTANTKLIQDTKDRISQLDRDAAAARAREAAAARQAAAATSAAAKIEAARISADARRESARIAAQTSRLNARLKALTKKQPKPYDPVAAQASAAKVLTRLLPSLTGPSTITKLITNALTGEQTPVKTTGRLPNYSRAIALIRASVEPILSPKMTPAQIDAWVHSHIDPLYPPGQFGRPLPVKKTAPSGSNPGGKAPAKGAAPAGTSKNDPFGLGPLLGG